MAVFVDRCDSMSPLRLSFSPYRGLVSAIVGASQRSRVLEEAAVSARASGRMGCFVAQDDAKRLVQELVVWPMLNPALCQARLTREAVTA